MFSWLWHLVVPQHPAGCFLLFEKICDVVSLVPSIMVAWGIVMTLMGLVHNFGGLLAARMALGLAEGGLFPGVAY